LSSAALTLLALKTAHNKIYTLRRGSLRCHRVLGPTRQRSLRPAKRELGFAGLASRFGQILACREDTPSQNLV